MPPCPLLLVQDGRHGVCVYVCLTFSHSSQDKEVRQNEIKIGEEVSDECSSRVMRVVHVDHSIPGVCSLYAEDSYR